MRIWVLIGMLFFSVSVWAQLADSTRAILQQYERKMVSMADTMVNWPQSKPRITNAYLLISMMKHALLHQGSWHYPFDSIPGITVLYPPDSSFRVFSWGVKLASNRWRHFGAIQYPGDDTLQLTPLIDGSDFMQNQRRDTVVDNNHWYGALYYNIIQRNFKGQPYYFLFGLDPNDPFSNRKVIEPLHFTQPQQPLFGAPVFHVPTKDSTIEVQHRFFIEYSDQASATLNYNAAKDLIMWDHLVPANPKSTGVYSTYIPDGTFEGFSWTPQGWKHVKKVFHYDIGHPDNPPMPEPIDFEAERNARQKAAERLKNERD